MYKSTIILLLLQLFVLGANAKTVPYLQAPTDRSIWVNWRTDSETESKVLFGEAENALDMMVEGSYQLITATIDNNFSYHYHSARLTGLKANTRYYYQVISGDEKSDVYSFKTQPTPGSEGIYRFIIMGDHQLNDDRYIRLMQAAKNKAEEKYGKPIEDHINLITNVGDQVNEGSPWQYYNIHFAKSEVLSPTLPIMTIVGNHELYKYNNQEDPLQYYNKHYTYADIEYQGIKSNTEFYYAMQQGRALFLMLDSDSPGTTQYNWAKKVIEKAKADDSVDWIFSYNHRPLQAEQYVGDVSPWVRDKIMPLLNETEKSVMNVAGHHHNYARGQLRDYPTYHIITGGASWNQEWSSAAGEGYTNQDFDDVQKTIAYWPFQIVELNSATRTMQVETYIIGNEKETLAETVLVDSFARTFGKAKPNKPSITNAPAGEVELPFTFESSAYSKTDYEYNSVQFQVAADDQFANLEFDLIRDYENIYGEHQKGAIFPDLNKGVDIFKQELKKTDLYDGVHYIRVRHRDRNLEWSDWSDVATFTTKNGNAKTTKSALILNKNKYTEGEDVIVNFTKASGDAWQWIGVYKEKQSYPGDQSVIWDYVSGTEGTYTFIAGRGNEGGADKRLTPGVYYAVLFSDGNYNELTRTELFYVGNVPQLQADKEVYTLGESVKISFTGAPHLQDDWLGVYKESQTPGTGPGTSTSFDWTYLRDANGAGAHSFEGLPEGDYFVTYLVQGEYYEPTDRLYFQVVSDATPTDPASSDPVATSVNKPQAATLTVSHNKAGRLLTITYPSNQPESLTLYSAAGTVIQSTTFTGSINLPTSGLSAGVYLLQVADRVEKVVIR